MNFKLSKKKIIISIIAGIILTVIMPFIWSLMFCQNIGCIAVVPKCDLLNPYHCCAVCISHARILTQSLTIFITSSILVYIGYSLFRKKS